MQPQSGLDQLSETGERIDSLLSALGTSGPMAQQRGEDLVALSRLSIRSPVSLS